MLVDHLLGLTLFWASQGSVIGLYALVHKLPLVFHFVHNLGSISNCVIRLLKFHILAIYR